MAHIIQKSSKKWKKKKKIKKLKNESVDDLEKSNEIFLNDFNILIQEFDEIFILKFLIILIYISELKKKEKLKNSIINLILKFIQILINFNLNKQEIRSNEEEQEEIKYISSLNLFLNFIDSNFDFLSIIEKDFKNQIFEDLNKLKIKNEQNFEGNLPEDLEIIGLPSPPIKNFKLSKINLIGQNDFEKIKLKRFFIFKNCLKKLKQLKKEEEIHQVFEIQNLNEDEIDLIDDDDEEEVILFQPMNEIGDPFNSNLNFNDFDKDLNLYFEKNLILKNTSTKTTTTNQIESMIWSTKNDEIKIDDDISNDKIIKNPFKTEKNENVWSPFVSNQNEF